MAETLPPIESMDIGSAFTTGAAQAPEPMDLSILPPPVSPVIAKTQAEKAHIGLGQTSPGLDALQYSIQSGTEDLERRRAVYTDATKYAQEKRDLLTGYMKSRPADAGPPTPEELQYIQRLTKPDVDKALKDPKSYFEEAYARRVIAESLKPQIDAARVENAPKTEELLTVGNKILAHQQYAAKLLQQVNDRYEQVSTAESVGFHIASAVPFVPWWRMQNALQGANSSAFLAGSNISEQAQAYYNMDTAQATASLDAVIKQLESVNPLYAKAYLEGFITNSSGQEFLGNAMSMADIAMVVPVTGIVPYKLAVQHAAAKVTGVGVQLTKTMTLEDGIKSVIKSVVKTTEHDPAVIAEAAGDIPTAAVQIANRMRELDELVETSSVGWNALKGSIPEAINPLSHFGPTNALSANRALRIREQLATQQDKLQEAAMMNGLNINRLTPGSAAQRQAGLEATNLANLEYPHAVDRLLNARTAAKEVEELPRALQATETAHRQAMADIGASGKMQAFQDYETLSFTLSKTTREIADLKKNPGKLHTASDANIPAHDITGIEKELNKILESNKKASRQDAKLVQLQKEQQDLIDLLKKVNKDNPEFAKAIKASIDADRVRNTKTPGISRLKVEPTTGEPKIVKGFGNVDQLILEFGDKDAALFATKGAAEVDRELLGLTAAKVVPHESGNGWLIEVRKALDETSPSVRNQMAIETAQDTPRSFANTFFSWLGFANPRSPSTR